MSRWRLIPVLLLVMCWSSGGFAEIKVIAHQKFPVDAITKVELRRLYLGHKSYVEHQRAHLFQLTGDILAQFCKEFLSLSQNKYEQRWIRQIFTGKGRIPKSFERPDDLQLGMLENEMSLGFMRMTEGIVLAEGLKVIEVLTSSQDSP